MHYRSDFDIYTSCPSPHNHHTTTTGIRITIIIRYYHINAGATCSGLGGRVMVKSYLLWVYYYYIPTSHARAAFFFFRFYGFFFFYYYYSYTAMAVSTRGAHDPRVLLVQSSPSRVFYTTLATNLLPNAHRCKAYLHGYIVLLLLF